MKITLSILILLACSCTMSYAQNPLTDSIQFATTNDEISRLPDLIKDPQNRRFLSVADKYHKYPIHYYLEHFYSSDNFEEDPYYDWTTVYEGLRALIEYGPGLNDWVDNKHLSAYAYILEYNWVVGEPEIYGNLLAQLLEFGADPYYKPKAKEKSPLEMAIEWELYDLIVAWKSYGIRFDLPLNKEKDLSILGAAISNYSSYDILSTMLDSTNVNHLEYDGTKSLLDLAEGDNGSEVLWMGFDVNRRYRKSPFETPLHRCAMQGKIDFIWSLLEAGADVNVKDVNGETPLIWALKAGKGDTAWELIENGADPRSKTKDGQSALDLARKTLKKDKDYIEMIEDEMSNYVEYKSENPVYTLDLKKSRNIGFMRQDFEISRILFESAEKGELMMYGPENEVLGPAELTEQIQMYVGPFEMPLEWVEGESYWMGDIVSHEGVFYEAIDFSESEPSEDSWEWIVTDMSPEYFRWSDISLIRYNLDGTPRLEFYVPAEFAPEGLERFIGSVDLEETVKILNSTDALWYQENVHDQKGGSGLYFYPDIFLFQGEDNWDFSEESSVSKQLLDSYYTGIIPMQEARYKYRIDHYLEVQEEMSGTLESGTGPVYNFPHSFNSELHINVDGNKALKIDILEVSDYNSKLGVVLSRDLWVLTDTSRATRVLQMGDALKCYECLDFNISDPQLKRFLTHFDLSPVEQLKMSAILEETIQVDAYLEASAEWGELFSEIFESAKNGMIQSYKDANLLQPFTMEAFEENLRKPIMDDMFLDVSEPFPWKEDESYGIGEMVLFNENQYESQSGENAGNMPASDSAFWTIVDNTQYLFRYMPEEVSYLKLFSKMDFNSSGKINDIKPSALGLFAFSEPNGDYYPYEYLIGYFNIEDLQTLPLWEKFQHSISTSDQRMLTGYSTLHKEEP